MINNMIVLFKNNKVFTILAASVKFKLVACASLAMQLKYMTGPQIHGKKNQQPKPLKTIIINQIDDSTELDRSLNKTIS